MNTYFKVLLGIIICLFVFEARSQVRKNIVPPSPNAASLGEYGEIPVSNYTGVPNIKIPLFNIKSGELELPINISYHASGIKVAQESSWVGLGWALNAGGVITRSVVGNDDLDMGFIANDPLPTYHSQSYLPFYPEDCQINHFAPVECEDDDIIDNLCSATDGLETILDCNSTVQDGEPDVFYYNFLGYSGRLVFQKGELKPYSVNQNSLDFEYDLANKKWVAIDDNGWRFIFGTKEYTSLAYSSMVGSPIENLANGFTKSVISSWYLDSIESPTGSMITFSYQDIGNFKSQKFYETVGYEHLNPEIDRFVGNGMGYCSSGAVIKYGVSVRETVMQKKLTRIDFNNGYLLFDSSSFDRHDILKSTIGNNYDKALSSVSLYNISDQPIKKYSFDYSYFNDNHLGELDESLYLRLKLNSLKEAGYDNLSQNWIYKPAYEFGYNSSVQLPSKISKSVDYYGYFNGKNNDYIPVYDYLDLRDDPYLFDRTTSPSIRTSYIVHNRPIKTANTRTPQISHISTLPPYYPNPSRSFVVFMHGIDAEPNEESAKAGILKKIKYPTGGTSSFSYNLNEYSSSLEDNLYKTNVETKIVNNLGVDEQSFTLNRESLLFLSMNFSNAMYHVDPANRDVTQNMVFGLQRADGTDVVKFIPGDDEDDIYMNYNTDQMSANVYVLLKPGTYTLKAKDGGYLYFSLNLKAKILQKQITNKKYGGGLRIVNHDTKSQSNEDINRVSYSYAGGKLMSPVKNFYSETMLFTAHTGGKNHNESDCCFNMTYGGILPKFFIVDRDDPSRGYQSLNTLKVFQNTIIPMGSSASGAPIGYDQITIEKYRVPTSNNSNVYPMFTSNEKIKSIYNYSNKIDEYFGNFFPNLPTKKHLSNGQLISEKNYNGNTLVRKKDYTYEKDVTSTVKIVGMSTLKIDTNYGMYGQLQGPPGFEDQYAIENLNPIAKFYEIYSEWWYLEEEIETLYDPQGNNPQIIKTQYSYDNNSHKKPTEIKTKNSDGISIITSIDYPQDLPNPTIDEQKMIDDHIFKKINVKKYLDKNFNDVAEASELLGRNHNKFKSWGAFVDLQYQSTSKSNNNLENRVEFLSYYTDGKIKEMLQVGGAITTYIWGYRNEYPIARIENASFSEVASFVTTLESLSNQDFDNCRDSSCKEQQLRDELQLLRSSLPDSQVTSFTYDPLIGVTSITDPAGKTVYYEYDEHHRLKFVKDQFGNLLNKNTYHYKNQ